MELKLRIIGATEALLNLLENCDDDVFVDQIVSVIYENDIAALWELEENLENIVDEDDD